MAVLTLTTPMKTMEQDRRDRCQKRGGFTLLEVMIVLFILVSMMTMAIVAIQGTRKQADQRTALAYIGMLRNALDRYAGEVGYPPTTEQGLGALVNCPPDLVNPGDWGGPYIQDTARSIDPWGNEYQYVSPPSRSGTTTRDFEIWSFGPDGRDGTEDDIGSWQN